MLFRRFVERVPEGRVGSVPGVAVALPRWALLILFLSALHRAAVAEVPVFVPPDACPAERLAGKDLARYLGRLHLADQFVLTDRLPETGRGIVVGCATNAAVRGLLNTPAPSVAESFLVASRRAGPRELGFVVGADPRGVAYGVYALLEKLGCGFYLSEDALPPGRRTPFTFDGWQLADRPLVRDRLVFDWHNFLSGCSTWNLADWNRWTDQSLKMGYNAIMVHAYGNNPMVSFSFNGKTKPVGYLSTTVKGRDWSTMHVNDVRRLWGGEIFDQPVFGADAAQAPEEQRAEAAQRLMRDVFAHAGQRGMEVYFADDVDTVSANPQELIRTLPEAARFAIQTQAVGWMGQDAGKLWLANPDSPEGQRYYQAQVAALLKAYPQITTLVVWFRTGGTPWMELKVAEMPPRWQEEWQAEIARTPEAEKLWHAPQIFAIGKIVRAFDRALKESGHARVQLAAGTWDFKFLAPCHRFFPPHVKLIGLDYNTLHGHPQLGDDESRKVIRDVAAQRPVIPVIWAHHDDGNYIGRPYTPLPEFASKLADAKASGFGIIHWTTRPLDLYFKSHIEQVWNATKDRALRATCDDMAARSFGANARGLMGEYLERWVTDAPNFARETTDFFIDRPLTNIAQVVAGCRERLKLIERVDVAKLSPEQRDRVNYFRGQEEFIAAFFQTHEQFQNAQAAFKKGDLATARVALAACQPEPVIKQFMKFSLLGGITRGEQGLIVSMNTRWLPQIVRLRQQLGQEPIRYNFGPTSHDPLAQLPGRFTFHFDAEHRLWQTLGAQETGATTFAAPQASHELCRSGIESDKPITLTLRPIAGARKDTATMPAGDHRLRLLFADPASSAVGQRVFTVSVAGTSPAMSSRIDIFKETEQANRLLERAYPLTVVSPGVVNVTLTPVQGKALICAAVLESVATKSDIRKQAAAEARPGGDVFSKPIITALLKDANSYQVRHPVMKGSNRNWERGTWYTGVMAAYQATGEKAFLDQALRWSEEHQWQPGTERSGGNILTCTQTYLELYFLKTNRTFIEPTIQWLNSGRTNTPSGAQVWYLEGGRRYADSLYVGAPPLAMLARITGDHKYIDWMSAFFWDVHREIFDEAAGLFYRDKRFIDQTTANGRKVLWSRGNGWAFASLPRILTHLPPDDPGRAKFVALFKQMAASIAKRQGADGFWRPNLDDPEQFPMPESSGTGFFCYGLAWGVRNGLLDRDAYLPAVKKAWAALAGCVSLEGRVQWGQLVGDRGVVVKQEDSHEYVTGTFLLAGSEVLRLAQAGIIGQPKRAAQPVVE